MVSVIIPAYNAEKFIDRCLKSVINQTYTDLQIIVINDGSEDNTLSVIRKYEEQDIRFFVIDQENRGVSSARNAGLNIVEGEYVLFIDSDDWIESNMIERMVVASQYDCDADVVLCGFDYAENEIDTTINGPVIYEVWNQYVQRVEFLNNKRLTGMLWNKLFKFDSIKDLAFNENISYGEDGEFVWKFFNNSKKMVVTNEVLYHHVIEQTSVTNSCYSEKKYSSVYVWEGIVNDVNKRFPELKKKSNERLTSVAVYGLYEMALSNYSNKSHKSHLRKIVKKYFKEFIISNSVSNKMKLYAIKIYLGL